MTEEYIKQIIMEELIAVLEEKKKTDKEKMKCNSPRRIRKGEAGHGKKKFVVKACDGGTEKIIRYGDANMEIKKDNPKRRKSFRARHNCDNPGSKLKARYWSCKKWQEIKNEAIIDCASKVLSEIGNLSKDVVIKKVIDTNFSISKFVQEISEEYKLSKTDFITLSS